MNVDIQIVLIKISSNEFFNEKKNFVLKRFVFFSKVKKIQKKVL